jgi:hypothetical protein
MRLATLTIAMLGALGGAALAFAQQPPAASSSCAPGPKLSYICGMRAPEDLVQVPGTDWIVASGLANAQQPGSGGLYLIDANRKTAQKVALPATGTARAPYDKCPGPLDPQRLSAHGLNIRAQGPGRAHLFVVGHGGREAIEVFEVAAGAGPPSLTWIGCIPAPAGAYMNSVTTLADGRVLATNFYNAPKTMQNALAGEDTGWVMQWKPGGQFEKLGGTDLPGPNGIEVSPDLKSLFVAVTGTSQVLRYDFSDTWKAPTFIRPNLRADNLRWAPDGRLLLAGPGPAPGGASGTAPAVVALDPATLKTTDVLRIPPDPNFPGHAAALVVGKTLWLGTYNGDRVAYAPLP